MSDYKSGNNPPEATRIDTSSPESTDFEPSESQIEEWQGDAEKTPAPVEAEKESEETPPAEEKKEAATYKAETKPKTPLQKHREKQSHEINEAYKQIRLLSKELRDLKAEKAKRDQGLDQKPEDWEELAKQFDQYGDYAKAQDARRHAEQLKQQQAQYQQSEAFVNQWHANEAEILEQDPDLFNPETETGRRMGNLFNNPENAELAARYRAHPDGIWAAYHRIKAEYATELIPKLVQVIETQQAELAKFKKSSAPLKSSPSGAGHKGPKSIHSMSDDELEKLAYAEAASIDNN